MAAGLRGVAAALPLSAADPPAAAAAAAEGAAEGCWWCPLPLLLLFAVCLVDGPL